MWARFSFYGVQRRIPFKARSRGDVVDALRVPADARDDPRDGPRPGDGAILKSHEVLVRAQGPAQKEAIPPTNIHLGAGFLRGVK